MVSRRIDDGQAKAKKGFQVEGATASLQLLDPVCAMESPAVDPGVKPGFCGQMKRRRLRALRGPR